MSFSSFLYQLLIAPIEIVFEVIFESAYHFLSNYGLSVIALSLAMNLLLLPMYRRADAIQDEERSAERRMEKAVAHIKKTFRGDERFMMLQTFYRQNNYKPFYVLKGFLPLALEIPFFIAAYHFLSNYQPMVGCSFGPIVDLGAPDRLLSAAGISINLLPILMTAVNFISSAIYTKGFPLKDKLQLYGMALVFLLLLYNSPAGLVIYWTLNNLFSLVKNLLGKLKHSRAIILTAVSAVGLALIVYAVFFYRTPFLLHRLIVVLGGALLEAPAVYSFLRRRFGFREIRLSEEADPKLFVGCCVFLAILTGMLIPSAVVASSPEEFIHVTAYYSPLRHVLNASLLSFGLFVIWFGIFYYMLGAKARRLFGLLMWVASVTAVVNYMFFGTNLGLLTEELHFEAAPIFSAKEKLINFAVLLILAVLLYLVHRKAERIAFGASVLLVLAILGMSGANIFKIGAATADIEKTVRRAEGQKAHFTISRRGENVVFIMLDRSLGFYVPYLFEEKPELAEQYAGFTYYPNTLSYGAFTRFATPSLYGGYEYTPEELNRRSGETMVEKQNEALKVLPVLFSNAGYQVTVCDPPLAGYQWIPDLSIFDGYEGIRTFNTEQGQFGSSSDPFLDQIWKRNFFCYSFMKCLPVALQSDAYRDGSYFGSIQNMAGDYERSVSVLKDLPFITRIDDSSENTFLSLNNSTTHSPRVLSMQDFLPDENISEAELNHEQYRIRTAPGQPPIQLSDIDQLKHYHINMAALSLVGDWLDYLRTEGVYDNTRIIIAADHGYHLAQLPERIIYPGGKRIDVDFFNPLFLVKDFNSDESFTTDERFMTNADVPSVAVSGLIGDAVNPFTGNPIDNAAKTESDPHVCMSYNWGIDEPLSRTFDPCDWFSVHDDIRDGDNWSYLGSK